MKDNFKKFLEENIGENSFLVRQKVELWKEITYFLGKI